MSKREASPADYRRLAALVEAFEAHMLGEHGDAPFWRVLEDVHGTRCADGWFDRVVNGAGEPVLGEELVAGELSRARELLDSLGRLGRGEVSDPPWREPLRRCATAGCPNRARVKYCSDCTMGLEPGTLGDV